VNDDARGGARALPPPIYLHFLDRELGDAFEFRLTLPTAARAISTLALGTASKLFCSLSPLLENEGLRGGEAMIGELVESAVLLPRSTHPSFDAFLDSRRAMYEHDRDRYPMYFGPSPFEGLSDLMLSQAEGSTTGRLHERMDAWVSGEPFVRAESGLPRNVHRRMEDMVAEELRRREDRAITFAMFSGIVGGDPSADVVEGSVRRRISIEYTDHQMGAYGQLATGLALPLEPIERILQPDWHLERDLPVLGALIEAAGLGLLTRGWQRALWQGVLPLRGSSEHVDVVSRMQWIARALDAALPRDGSRDMRRKRATAAIAGATIPAGRQAAMEPGDLLVNAQGSLDGVAAQLAAGGLAAQLDAARDALVPLWADVLLIVATDVEEIQTLAEFGYPPGTSPRRHPFGQRIYLELGTFSGSRVFLVRSEMGSAGPAGSAFTADDAIRDLRPRWTLMLGIAFGVDPSDQEIGDVLVPTEIALYDHKRIGTTKEGEATVSYRDGPGRPDPALVGRLRAARLDFGGAAVLFGRLLSGSELVDNEAHREVLVAEAAGGKAIGGEMELAGLFAAAEREKGRWAAAKAICDFADGQKKKDKEARQRLAANNSARFARHVIGAGLLNSAP
jgi:nucleoside phosphorylase